MDQRCLLDVLSPRSSGLVDRFKLRTYITGIRFFRHTSISASSVLYIINTQRLTRASSYNLFCPWPVRLVISGDLFHYLIQVSVTTPFIQYFQQAEASHILVATSFTARRMVCVDPSRTRKVFIHGCLPSIFGIKRSVLSNYRLRCSASPCFCFSRLLIRSQRLSCAQCSSRPLRSLRHG